MRVIAGTWKGRRLSVPTWEGLRPTSDKLRETAFNVLGPRVREARVLDAYAGTGAVGIEALSRGAAWVTFVERDRRAIELVRRNLATCRATDEEPRRYTVDTADVTRWSGVVGSRFDLIWLDPPYADSAAGALTQLRPWVTEDGLAVLEHATRRTPDVPAGWVVTRVVTSGDSALTLLHPTPHTHDDTGTPSRTAGDLSRLV